MAKYYCVENGDVVTTDDVRGFYEEAKRAGNIDPDEPFYYYLAGCMTRNNGSLQPIAERISELRRDLFRVLRLADIDPANRDDYDDEADVLKIQIADLERINKEA